MSFEYSITWDAAGYVWDDQRVYWDGYDRNIDNIRAIFRGGGRKARKVPLVDISLKANLCYVNGDPYITGNSSEGNSNVVRVVGEIPIRNIETLAVQLGSGQNTVNIEVYDITLKENDRVVKMPIIKAVPLVPFQPINESI